jgi:hypothetical protein
MAKFRINDLTEDAPPEELLTVDPDTTLMEFEVPDALNYKGTISQLRNQYLVEIPSAKSRATLANSDWNTIDPNGGINTNILSGGTLGNPLNLGSNTYGVQNSDTVTRDTDTGYVEGSVVHAFIAHGYDGAVNAIASAIFSCFHSLIEYTIRGHHMIGGGSYHRIRRGGDSGYCSIFGGTAHEIADGRFHFIGGGSDNYVESTVASIGGSSILGGINNRIEGSEAAGILWGSGNTVGTTSPHAMASGEDCEANASKAVAIGESVINNAINSFALGKGFTLPSSSRGSFARGSRNNGTSGDVFTMLCQYSTSITDSTSPNVSMVTDSSITNIQMNGDDCVMSGEAIITAHDRINGKVAVWRLPCVAKRIAGSSTRMKGAIADLVVIESDGGWYTGSGVQMAVSASSGNIYFQAWGMASRTIDWSAEINWTVLNAV